MAACLSGLDMEKLDDIGRDGKTTTLESPALTTRIVTPMVTDMARKN